MGSKRKLHSLSTQDDHYKKAKVKNMQSLGILISLTLAKNNHQDHTSLNEKSNKKDNIRARLGLLEKTIREITCSPESIQSHSAEAGSDVVEAAIELGKAIYATNPSSSTCQETIDYGPKLHDGSSTVEIKDQNFLPRLPTIPDGLLEKAVFTHPGMSNNNEATYDRLEILGDAYIELIATKLIWDTFRDLPSGRISQIRESLVKNETLSEFATRYGFHLKALVPRDYLKQPKRWIKTMGDIFEAYVAAVILSNPADGYKTVENWLRALWMPQLASIGDQTICLHAKEALAKRIMGKGIKLRYIDEHPPIQLEGGKQIFSTGVYLTGWGWNNSHLGSGQGLNKVMAGNQAAQQALQNEQLINKIMAVKEAHEAEKKENNSFS